MKNHSKKIALLPVALLLAALCLIGTQSAAYRLDTSEEGTVRDIPQVEYKTDTGASGTLALPGRLEGLASHTLVTLTAQISAQPGEALLLKSVFAPMTVFLDGEPVLEYGQAGSYPGFLNDPPTALLLLPLPPEGGTVSLRITYQSLTQRGELSLPSIYVGTGEALLERQFAQDGFLFIFSLVLIFIGLVMLAVSLGFVWKIPSGASFSWLGLFSLSAGIWGFGECDLTVLLLPYPALLYAMAYLGLFLVTLPLLRFGLLVVQPKDKRPMQWMLWVHCLSVAAALLLQLSGRMDFTKSLYWFHIIAPLGFVTFAACLLWEWLRNRNPAAGRFAPGIVLLAVFTVLELLNYWLHFTVALTLFFQLGVVGFVLSLGVVSGYYMRDSLQTAAEKKRLEYQMEAVNRQLALQRMQFQKIAENDALIKSQRHDLRHQLTVLRELYEQNDREKLGRYLEALTEKLPSGREPALCENYAVNAVASHYADLARQAGAEVSVQLSVPPELPAALESDLCVIVGNLMENAAEACARMTGGARFVRVGSHLQHGVLTLAVDNSFEGKLCQKDGIFLSSKREGEGIGTVSVAAVAKKYGGSAQFEEKDGMFQASVYVRIS